MLTVHVFSYLSSFMRHSKLIHVPDEYKNILFILFILVYNIKLNEEMLVRSEIFLLCCKTVFISKRLSSLIKINPVMHGA